MERRLVLTPELVRVIVDHLDRNLPEEACGLIAGLDTQARQVFPVENELHSPVRFQMAPLEQLKVFEQIEAVGLELIAIFHSHPQGPDHPSQTDVGEFYYPGVAVLIASPLPEDAGSSEQPAAVRQGKWQFKAYSIEEREILAVKLSLVP